MPLTGSDSAHGQYPRAVLTTASGKALFSLQGPMVTQYQLLAVDLVTGQLAIRIDAGSPGVETALITRSPVHDLLVVPPGSGTEQPYHSATDQFGPLTRTPPDGGRSV